MERVGLGVAQSLLEFWEYADSKLAGGMVLPISCYHFPLGHAPSAAGSRKRKETEP